MRKVEIKKLKVCRGHETDAFSCDFHVEGTLVAHVTQSGDGGCHIWNWTIARAAQEKLKADLLAEAKADKPTWATISDFDENSEFHLYAADAKRAEKKRAANPAPVKYIWDDPGMHTEALDLLIWHLVETEGETKRRKRLCKTKTLFRISTNKPEEYMTVDIPWAGNETRVRSLLAKKFGPQLVEIINETLA